MRATCQRSKRDTRCPCPFAESHHYRDRASSTAAASERNRAIDETRPGRYTEVRRVVSTLVLDDLLDIDTIAMITMMKSTAPTIIATIGSMPSSLVRSVSTILSVRFSVLTSVRESLWDCFISDGAAGWDD
jgi:hypothetical protein